MDSLYTQLKTGGLLLDFNGFRLAGFIRAAIRSRARVGALGVRTMQQRFFRDGHPGLTGLSTHTITPRRIKKGITALRQMLTYPAPKLAWMGLGLLCLPFGAPLHAFPQQQSDVAAIISSLRHGENGQALAAADHALKTSPGDCRLLSLKGMALSGMNEPAKSLHVFKQTLTRCPQYLPALEGAAQIEYAQHDPAAIPTLKHILEIKPENMTAEAMLASIYRGRGDCASALSYFEASKPLFPSRPELMQGYGSCLAHLGKYNAALPIYQELLSHDPSDSTRYDVAFLQWKLGSASEALTTLAPLLKADSYEPAFTLGAKISEESGDTPRAVKLLRSAILLSPSNVDNYLDFANLAFKHNSFQVGIDIVNAGLKKLPGAARLYVARGVLEVQLSRNQAAVADFEHAHQLDPKLSFALDAMGVLQSQMHHDRQSLALFQSAVQQHPHDALLRYLLAEQLSRDAAASDPANMKKAIASAKMSVELDPTYQPAHDLLAMLYVKTGQKALAIDQAKIALAHDPDDQTALYQEIMARRGSGDTAELRTLTQRLQKLHEQNAQKRKKASRYQLQDDVSH